MELVEITATDTGQGLLASEVEIEVALPNGRASGATLALPPGGPQRPSTAEQLGAKLSACAGDDSPELAALNWETARPYLERRSADVSWPTGTVVVARGSIVQTRGRRPLRHGRVA
jgi:hypothetical protein